MRPEVVFRRELEIEDFLRRNLLLLGCLSILTATSLYIGIFACMNYYKARHYWISGVSGLLAHAFFVITMHDGAHQSLTQSKYDRWIMNTCSGLIILPIYTELFRKFHLLHHAHTNTELDPLWASNKRNLFEKHRYLYAFL